MHVTQQPQTYSCDIPTHKTTSPAERPFSHYIRSHRLAAEMWTTMKNNVLGKTFLSCSFYLCGFRKYVSYGFPIINCCNPGVLYETPFVYFFSNFIVSCFCTPDYSMLVTITYEFAFFTEYFRTPCKASLVCMQSTWILLLRSSLWSLAEQQTVNNCSLIMADTRVG